MSKLLGQESKPMIVSPTLAIKIGLNKAIVLQQVHYWLTISKHVIHNRKWVYNSYREWNKQFPFWSLSMVKRLFQSLEEQGYLISGSFNKSRMDQTKWYSIDYDKLENLLMNEVFLENGKSAELSTYEDQKQDVQMEDIWLADKEKISPSLCQTEPISCSKQADEESVLSKPIPEISTENSSKTTAKKEKECFPYSQVITYLNEKNHSCFRANNRKTMAAIRARCREGYLLEDFIKVIDIKVAEWRRDPCWSKYLRPETLFGSKFESYLNQRQVKKELREEDFDLRD